MNFWASGFWVDDFWAENFWIGEVEAPQTGTFASPAGGFAAENQWNLEEDRRQQKRKKREIKKRRWWGDKDPDLHRPAQVADVEPEPSPVDYGPTAPNPLDYGNAAPQVQPNPEWMVQPPPPQPPPPPQYVNPDRMAESIQLAQAAASLSQGTEPRQWQTGNRDWLNAWKANMEITLRNLNGYR